MSSFNRTDFFNNSSAFLSLPPAEREFIRQKSEKFHLSFQYIKRMIEMAQDLEMWEEGSLSELWQDHEESRTTGKNRTKLVMGTLIRRWEAIRSSQKDYTAFIPETPKNIPGIFSVEEEETTLLGKCPVASSKTRCCNLETLDAVKGCGFACSYCSIQSFYTEGKIVFQKDFVRKLHNLVIDPARIYHIGTGQSSDSLMWGNKEGLLDALFDFASIHPNVILELKTKSDNIAYFKNHDVPQNVLVTWSLNTDTIITAEEHRTASLTKRLAAAREIADTGLLIGFHFHPMVYYKNWDKEYAAIFSRIQELFSADEVVLISLGTLTFIKPVIKELRKHRIKSKILQMSMDNAGGKLSYPLEIKRRMFGSAYRSFSEEWKKKVFFYMCMEDPSLWKEVFGYQYDTNDDFEHAMKAEYMKKISETMIKRSVHVKAAQRTLRTGRTG